MKKSYKERNGITLVSLVITIVIMLILAGITISFVIGKNGLFTKSKQSAESYKISSDIEQIKNAWNEYVTDSTERDYILPLTLDAFDIYVTDNNVLNVINKVEDKLYVKVNDKTYEVIKVNDGIEVKKVDEVAKDRYYVLNYQTGLDDWNYSNPVLYGTTTSNKVSKGENYINFDCAYESGTVHGIMLKYKNKIDLTKYNTIHMLYDIEPRINSNNDYSYIILHASKNLPTGWNMNWYNANDYAGCVENGDANQRTNQQLDMDVSKLSGEYGLFLQDCNIQCKIYKIWAE